MELLGAISMGEWSYLGGMYTSEEANFSTHELFAQCAVPNESSNLGLPSSFCPGHEFLHVAGIGSHYSSEIDDSYLYSLSQESSQNGGSSNDFPASSNENFYLSECHPTLGIDYNGSPTFCSKDFEKTNLFLIEGDERLHQEVGNGIVEESGRNHPQPFVAESNSQLKWDAEMTVPDSAMENKNPSRSSKKRCRNPVEMQKNKRNVRSRKSLKLVITSDNEEDGNGGNKGQSSSSCCTGDDSNTYQELSEGVATSSSPKGTAAFNLNGKARATKGSATDPQSVYARKRREKINERLRMLQNLVPNGTKVDISTMLEEAVQYVKFLQLQIKLLSSDDLWMYAPIAYNGMNIGFDLRIANPKPT